MWDNRHQRASQVAQCSLSSLAFLLSELVQYSTSRCASHEEMVSRLSNAGYEVGRRAIELVTFRC
jgi:Transport protein particle (TRAPP) component